MFTPEYIRARMRQQPFTPVRIVTSSGESYEVFYPDLVWVGGRDLQVGTPMPGAPAFYDMVARVAIMHITALQDLPTLIPPQTGNGQG